MTVQNGSNRIDFYHSQVRFGVGRTSKAFEKHLKQHEITRIALPWHETLVSDNQAEKNGANHSDLWISHRISATKFSFFPDYQALSLCSYHNVPPFFSRHRWRQGKKWTHRKVSSLPPISLCNHKIAETNKARCEAWWEREENALEIIARVTRSQVFFSRNKGCRKDISRKGSASKIFTEQCRNK